MLSSVRFPSNGGGDLIFIKSFEDDAISLSGFGSGFRGVKGVVNFGFGGSNIDVRVKRSGMGVGFDVRARRSGTGAGFTIGFGSRDKVSITSAAVSAKVSCSMVGISTSSASAYSRPVSSLGSSKGSFFISFSCSDSDSPDGSALSQ